MEATRINTTAAYQKRITEITGDPSIIETARTELTTMYTKLFDLYAFQNAQGCFIKDPSQGNQIVSEGQAYWMLISAHMARIDTGKARIYQRDFDALLKGTQSMIALAKQIGNGGEFAAWKVKIEGSVIVLDKDQWGPTANSAADADIDLIRSLIYAQELVDAGIWEDRGYAALALKLIPHAEKALFSEQGGFIVMKPSEDWNDFLFTDYLSPAACMDIAAFLKKNGKADAFWQKAASDSMTIYQKTLTETGEFPAHIRVSATQKALQVKREHDTHQYFDGIRAPWKISTYIIGETETKEEYSCAVQALKAGVTKDLSFTGVPALDEVMYLPLALSLGDSKVAQDIVQRLKTNKVPANKYYENSLYMLSLLDAYFPRKIDIGN